MRKVLMTVFMCSMFLTGCVYESESNPIRVEMQDDGTILVHFYNDDYTINASSPKSYVDQLLGSVDLPSNVERSELKKFVYENLDKVGVDMDSIDFDTEELNKFIQDALESKGVNLWG